jgi:hypothetical protein
MKIVARDAEAIDARLERWRAAWPRCRGSAISGTQERTRVQAGPVVQLAPILRAPHGKVLFAAAHRRLAGL